MSIDRELFKVIRILMSLRNLPPDFYSPFDDLNSVSFLSTSALKKASTNDQKNQQTPNPKEIALKALIQQRERLLLSAINQSV
jgi:hypothetical protein